MRYPQLCWLALLEFHFSRDDLELLAGVKSDLGFLEDEWDESIDEQSLRRSSTVLRNLLVNDALGRAWRLVGQKGQPQLEAVDLVACLAGLVIDTSGIPPGHRYGCTGCLSSSLRRPLSSMGRGSTGASSFSSWQTRKVARTSISPARRTRRPFNSWTRLRRMGSRTRTPFTSSCSPSGRILLDRRMPRDFAS
jgi:hypothetical protein